jgi:hypothetical protein
MATPVFLEIDPPRISKDALLQWQGADYLFFKGTQTRWTWLGIRQYAYTFMP